MPFRTRTSRVVAAGLALVTASALTACSSDSEEPTDAPGSASESAEQSSAAPVDETPPTTPMAEVLLSEGEAPGNGVIQTIPADLLTQAQEKLEADQGKQLMDEPACDKVARLETVANHATGDAVTAVVRYKQAEDDDTEHRYGIGMVPLKLDEYLDRSLYEACTTSKSSTNPAVELRMSVSDAPAVEGAQGFRVTSDFITTRPDGGTTINRHISLHGFANGTSTNIEYMAQGADPEADPVLPQANDALVAIYTTQMDKLVKAE